MTELVGATPLLQVSFLNKTGATVLAKLECFNPTGSAKDRPALEMILEAEKEGLIKKGATIIEPTSGNTGIALAAIGASKGYKVIIVMPDTMSKERILLTKAYGAQVVLTDGSLGMKGSIEKAEELAKGIENSFIPSQFTNTANPLSHYKTTAARRSRTAVAKLLELCHYPSSFRITTETARTVGEASRTLSKRSMIPPWPGIRLE